MKKILTSMALAMIFFACRKTDLQVKPLTNAESADDIAAQALSKQVKVLNNKLNYPWEILWGPDNYIWFTEREGYVKRMDPSNGKVTLVKKINDVASTTNFNGLLGMVLHPNFES